MNEKISKRSSFETNALIVFGLSILANAINGIFQILSGKLLGTTDYGMVNVVNSYVTYLGVFCGPIVTMACCYSAKLYADKQQVAGFIRWIIKYSLILEIFICIAGVCAALLMRGIFGEETFRTAVFVVLLLPTNSFYIILLSIIQGMQKFTIHGLVGLVFYGTKVLVSVFLIQTGWGSFGVISGLLISQILCVGLCLFLLCDYLTGSIPKIAYSYHDLTDFYSSIFLLQLFYFFYINGGDIIILDLFFSKDTVGEYSAAIMLCKLLFYVITPLTTVLLPNVAEKNSRGMETRGILRKAVFYALVITCGFGIVLWLLGGKILILLYGTQYQNAQKYLAFAFIYTVSLVILSLVYSYQTAIGQTRRMTLAFLVMGICMSGALGIRHDSPQMVVGIISILLMILDGYTLVLALGGRDEKKN